MKHVILVDNSLNGREFGSLRSFENAIIKYTNAEVVEMPKLNIHYDSLNMGHSMRLGKLRKFAKKQKLIIKADVLWCIIMGPENYKLDLFSGWSENVKFRILYLFDTLPHQVPLIKRLFSDNLFNIKISSFVDSIEILKKETSQIWYSIEQGASASVFKQIPIEDKKIHFSSYGRKNELVHQCVKTFCGERNLYYDYSTEIDAKPVCTAEELYKQYAWHLSNSIFTFSWPVELTNPNRAGYLNPITCRWFEAAVANTILIGKPPNNKKFQEYFNSESVINLDISNQENSIITQLQKIWDMRYELQQKNTQFVNDNFDRFTWELRVKEIISLIN